MSDARQGQTSAGVLRDAAGASVSPAGAGRRVGRWGRAARLAVGFALVTLALAYWDARWLDVLVGLALLPALATLVMSWRPRSAPPLRLGAAGHLVTLAHVALTTAVVPDAAALFYGSMTLLAGLRGDRGCEVTAVANALRDRDDQIGCPLFAPFDRLDGRARTGACRS